MVRPGHGSDGGQGNEFGEFVRHALHAAADQVDPSPDGLQRIRDKIRSGPAYATAQESQAAAKAGFLAALVRRWHALRGRPTAPAARPAKPGPARQAPQRPRDWREAMLRPAFAVGFALFAVGVVLATVPTIRTELATSVGLGSPAVTSGQSRPGGAGSANGIGASHVSESAGGVGPVPATTCPSSTASSHAPVSQNVTKSSSSTPPGVHSTASASESTAATASPSDTTTVTVGPTVTVTVTNTATPPPAHSSRPSAKPTAKAQTTPTPTASCTSTAPAPTSAPATSSKPKTQVTKSPPASKSSSPTHSAATSPPTTASTGNSHAGAVPADSEPSSSAGP